MNKVELMRRCSVGEPVVIIGAGASGVLSAIALLRSSDRHVVLVERDGSWSTGPAYATSDPRHLLNVPAGKLSVDSTQPCDFVDWASARIGGVSPATFLPRSLYGGYLRAALDAAERGSAPGALTKVTAEAVGLERVCAPRRDRVRMRVTFADGRSIDGAQIVLALGNPPSRALACEGDAVIDDPWSVCASPLVSADDAVVIVGSRLTAVDVALSLAGRGHRGSIRMVSRYGLLPAAHGEHAVVPAPLPDLPPALTARALVAWFRAAIAETGDWRAVFDAIRPRTNEIWRALPEAERKRLLRHVLRHWEVHRHRMAPDVAHAVGALVESGRVEVVAGVVTGVACGPHGTSRVIVRDPRGARTTLDAHRVVNCAGASFDLRRSATPLVRELLDRGLARPGPLGLGLDVTADGSLVDAAGRASSAVSVVGPLRRGAEWETTAIPEIRAHAESLARRLASGPRPVAHSVRGVAGSRPVMTSS